jgi:hypothetical protein
MVNNKKKTDTVTVASDMPEALPDLTAELVESKLEASKKTTRKYSNADIQQMLGLLDDNEKQLQTVVGVLRKYQAKKAELIEKIMASLPEGKTAVRFRDKKLTFVLRKMKKSGMESYHVRGLNKDEVDDDVLSFD